ncbi:MAG TPA: hypothetical protein VJP58_09470 [Candidatus Nitrosocosmicus sp.]|nr:hypothetical protein [Candidatus Nitrosocosmicus sp.]
MKLTQLTRLMQYLGTTGACASDFKLLDKLLCIECEKPRVKRAVMTCKGIDEIKEGKKKVSFS